MNRDSNHQPSDEFNQQVSKFLTILKKILRNNKFSQEEVKKIFGEIKSGKENLNLNIFFLNVMPLDGEEFEEIGSDLEEFFDEDWEKEEAEEELRFELSSHDEDFLKKHGIRF